MEIVEISKGRLKVVLDAEELRDFSIDLDRMDYGTQKTQKALESILAVVCAKTDLETDKGRTYVQLYPSRDGGCELFLVHISALDEQEGRALIPFKEQIGYLCVLSAGAQACFFEQLLAARGILKLERYEDREGGRCFYYLPCTKEHLFLLEEFGGRVDRDVRCFLREHFSANDEPN